VSQSLYMTKHPVVGPRTGKPITFTFDDRRFVALEGETIAYALWGAGIRVLGSDERNGHARGIFCGIGHCYNCRVTIDGVADVRSCITPAREGMEVRSQKGPEKEEWQV